MLFDNLSLSLHLSPCFIYAVVQFEVYLAGRLFDRAFKCAVDLRDPELVLRVQNAAGLPDKILIACRQFLEPRNVLAESSPRRGDAKDREPVDW